MATETQSGAPAIAYPGAEPTEAVGAVVPPLPPHLLCIFGATGELARRKLLPGLLHLYQANLMPEFRVLGISLEELSGEEFRELAAEACREFGHHEFDQGGWDYLSPRLSYLPVQEAARRLQGAVERVCDEMGAETRLLHY